MSFLADLQAEGFVETGEISELMGLLESLFALRIFSLIGWAVALRRVSEEGDVEIFTVFRGDCPEGLDHLVEIPVELDLICLEENGERLSEEAA